MVGGAVDSRQRGHVRNARALLRASVMVRAWLLLAGLAGLGLHAEGTPKTTASRASSGSVSMTMDDVERWRRFADELGDRFKAGETLPMGELKKQLAVSRRVPVRMARPARQVLEPEQVYQQCASSVVAVGSVYKCPRCPHWHTGGTATGWVMGDRGEIVSNYHVLAEIGRAHV